MKAVRYVVKRRLKNTDDHFVECYDACEDDGQANYEELHYAKFRLVDIRARFPECDVFLFRRYISVMDHIMRTL